MATFDERKLEIFTVKDQIKTTKLLHPVNAVCDVNIDRSLNVVTFMREKLVTVNDKTNNLISSFAANLSEADITQLRDESEEFLTEYIEYVSAMELKISEVRRAAAVVPVQASTERDVRIATKRATNKANQVKSDLTKLSDEFQRIEANEWTEAFDHQVETGMKKIDTWQELFNNIVAKFREATDILNQQDIDVKDVPPVAEAGRQLRDTEFQLGEVKIAIEMEDERRELYCNKSSATEKVKYPVFEGKDGECFHEFKEKMENCFRQNKVRREDKVAKLRESLKGHSKKLIPESQKNIDNAWDALEKAFGDSTKLMRHHIKLLKELGKVPRMNGKAGIKAGVEWHLNLEVIIQGMLDLAERTDDKEIQNTLYHISIIRSIANLLKDPHNVEVLHCEGGHGRVRLQNCLDLISGYRETCQLVCLARELDDDDPPPRPANNGGGRGGHGGGVHVTLSLDDYCLDSLVTDKFEDFVKFQPPQIYRDCRFCQALERRGDSLQLYTNHHSNAFSGCPRFLCATSEERNQVCRSAKVCLRCLNPSYTFQYDDPAHGFCNSYSSLFKCSVKNCRLHILVCENHSNQNQAIMEKLESELYDKTNLQLAMVCGTFRSSNISLDNSSLSNSNQSSNSSQSSTSSPKSNNSSFNSSTHSSSTNVRKTSSAALSELKAELKANEMHEMLKPVNRGSPQFIMGLIKGKSRPLLSLFDTGCLGLVMKAGVPENELAPAVKKASGPFHLNGVGNTTVIARDEWMCTVKLRDGSRAIIEGITVDEISAPLPLTCLNEAEKYIKSTTSGLDNLKCYDLIGGSCDLLIGVGFQNLFPRPIHQLESGLTIYEMIMESHDPMYSGTIGGCHESFQSMSHFLGAAFPTFVMQQLENYNKFGPVKLSQGLLSVEDKLFVEQHDEVLDVQEDPDENHEEEAFLIKPTVYEGNSELNRWFMKGDSVCISDVSNHICRSETQEMFSGQDDCHDDVFLKEVLTEIRDDDSQESIEVNEDTKDDPTHLKFATNHATNASDKYNANYSSELNENAKFQMQNNANAQNENALLSSQVKLKSSTNQVMPLFDNIQPPAHEFRLMSCDVPMMNEVDNDLFSALIGAMMIASFTAVHIVVKILLSDNNSLITSELFIPEPGSHDDVFSDVIDDATDVSGEEAVLNDTSDDVPDEAAKEDEVIHDAFDDVTTDSLNDELDACTRMFLSQSDVTNVSGLDQDLVSDELVWSYVTPLCLATSPPFNDITHWVWSDSVAGKSILFIIFDKFLPQQQFYAKCCQMFVSDDENDVCHDVPAGVGGQLSQGHGPDDDPVIRGGPKGNDPGEDGVHDDLNLQDDMEHCVPAQSITAVWTQCRVMQRPVVLAVIGVMTCCYVTRWWSSALTSLATIIMTVLVLPLARLVTNTGTKFVLFRTVSLPENNVFMSSLQCSKTQVLCPINMEILDDFMDEVTEELDDTKVDTTKDDAYPAVVPVPGVSYDAKTFVMMIQTQFVGSQVFISTYCSVYLDTTNSGRKVTEACRVDYLIINISDVIIRALSVNNDVEFILTHWIPEILVDMVAAELMCHVSPGAQQCLVSPGPAGALMLHGVSGDSVTLSCISLQNISTPASSVTVLVSSVARCDDSPVPVPGVYSELLSTLAMCAIITAIFFIYLQNVQSQSHVSMDVIKTKGVAETMKKNEGIEDEVASDHSDCHVICHLILYSLPHCRFLGRVCLHIMSRHFVLLLSVKCCQLLTSIIPPKQHKLLVRFSCSNQT